MLYYFKSYFSYFVAACLALHTLPSAELSAQNTSSKDAVGTFRILQVGSTEDESFMEEETLSPTIPSEILYLSKEGEVQLSLGSRRPSQPYPLPQGKTLELYRWLPVPANAPEGTKPEKQILGQIPLGNVSQQLVFVAISKKGRPYPIRGLAIDDLVEDHLPGQARLINLSSYGAAIAMEEEKAKAKSKSADTIIQFAPGMTDIIIAIEVNEGGKWAKAHSRKLRLNGSIKVYAILYDHPPTPDDPLPVRASIFSERVRTTTTTTPR